VSGTAAAGGTGEASGASNDKLNGLNKKGLLRPARGAKGHLLGD